MVTSHETYMYRCLQLASKGLGRVSPNPLVGSIIVYNDQIIGQGYHFEYGGSHAEVNAIQSVENKSLLPESTLYVNLEPCSHYGKTPPCADLIIHYRFKKVVIGTQDPFPEVAGKGIQRLRNAGIEVEVGVLEEECSLLNRRFFTYHLLQRPYIILKWASSLDGYLSPGNHKPENRNNWWITGKIASVLVHKWRSEEDCIMVGTNTLLTDDPALNVREWFGADPLRLIIDMHLKIPLSSNVMRENGSVVILNSLKDEVQRNRIYRKVPEGDELIPAMLKILHSMEKQSILVEGGGNILNQFLRNGIWDEARVLTGNVFFGKGIDAPKIRVPPSYSDYAGDDKLYYYFNENKTVLISSTTS